MGSLLKYRGIATGETSQSGGQNSILSQQSQTSSLKHVNRSQLRGGYDLSRTGDLYSQFCHMSLDATGEELLLKGTLRDLRSLHLTAIPIRTLFLAAHRNRNP